MKTIYSDKDINVFCIRAHSFPAGIEEAFDKLHAKFPQDGKRRFYGISHPTPGGNILYRAGAEKLTGDLDELEVFVVRKGNYAVLEVNDFMNNPGKIGEAFNTLLKHPLLDPQGACIELYSATGDVSCMVRLKE